MNKLATINRKAEIGDIAAMVYLTGELGYPTTFEDMEKRFLSIASHPDYRTLVTIHADKVIAMIGMARQYAYEENGLYVRVLTLVVDTRFHDRGIGRSLMQEAEKWARQLGSQKILVNCGMREERTRAHQFYQRLGYVPKSMGFAKTRF